MTKSFRAVSSAGVAFSGRSANQPISAMPRTRRNNGNMARSSSATGLTLAIALYARGANGTKLGKLLALVQGRGEVVHVPAPRGIVEIDRCQRITVHQNVAGMQVRVDDAVSRCVLAIADQQFV